MAKKHGPIPQEQGQLVPPSRRPPVAIAVATPDPPEKRFLFRIVKQLAGAIKQKFRRLK